MRLYRLLAPALSRRRSAPNTATSCAPCSPRADAPARGPIARLACGLPALADVVANAARAHADLLAQDLRHTAARCRRAPGFALTAIVVAALGVGADDRGLLARRPRAGAAAAVSRAGSAGHALAGPVVPRAARACELSPANYRDWRADEHVVRVDGGVHDDLGQPDRPGGPERLDGVDATADLFDTLRAPAALGRVFAQADGRAGAAPAVVLSDGLWRAQFGADPGVLGRTVMLSDEPHVVIGVMPRGFFFPTRETDFWVQTRFDGRERR